MNEEAGKILTKARKDRNLTQEEMAKKLADALHQGYSQRQYQKLEDGDFPKYKKEIAQALDKLLSTNLHELVYEHKVPYRPEQKHEQSGSVVSDVEAPFNGSMSMKAIISLADSNRGLVESNKALVESNRIIADANKAIADANVILARNNEELIQLMKKPTAHESEEIPAGVQSRLTQILGLIAQVGSGKRWKSIEEAAAELHIEFSGTGVRNQVADIHSGSGKRHI